MRPIRRLNIPPHRSAAWFVDALSLLPPDSIITYCGFDVGQADCVFYIEHPDFTPVEDCVSVPLLYVETESFRSLLFDYTMRPVRLRDDGPPITKAVPGPSEELGAVPLWIIHLCMAVRRLWRVLGHPRHPR